MGIFGKLDAALIPTNPFWVEQGEYPGEVTDAKFKDNRDNQKQLVLEYTIEDENSQFNGQKVSQYFTLVDSEMTQEAFALLPSEEQKSIRRTNSALKRTLCGSDVNTMQKGLGVDPEDLDETWQPSVLIGTKVDIGVSNYGAKNEGVNVKWVNLRD